VALHGTHAALHELAHDPPGEIETFVGARAGLQETDHGERVARVRQARHEQRRCVAAAGAAVQGGPQGGVRQAGERTGGVAPV